MLDPTLLRSDLDRVRDAVERRHQTVDFATYSALEERRRALQVETEQLQAERNTRSKAIGKAKAAGEDIQPLLDAVADLGDQLKSRQGELEEVQGGLQDFMLGLPNIPHDSVPVGTSEDDNLEMRRWGEPRTFTFDVRDHVDLGALQAGMDFEAGAATPDQPLGT